MNNFNNNPYNAYAPYQPQNSYGMGGYSHYAPQPQPQVQQSVSTNKIYVNGIEDVKCRQMPINSDYIFLDNDQPLVYRKTTDGTGKMSIQVFKIIPYEDAIKSVAPEIDLSAYVQRKELDELKAEITALKEAVTKPASSKKASV